MTDFGRKTVYQVYPKSFRDSDGDGFGDIRGIIEKLDYLKELEIDYLWITPVFISPMNDNGYDVADYYKINPQFGTMEDMDELIRECDNRGIGLMLIWYSTTHPQSMNGSGEPLQEKKISGLLHIPG